MSFTQHLLKSTSKPNEFERKRWCITHLSGLGAFIALIQFSLELLHGGWLSKGRRETSQSIQEVPFLGRIDISRTPWRMVRWKDGLIYSLIEAQGTRARLRVRSGWTTGWDKALSPSVLRPEMECTCCFKGPPFWLPVLNYSKRDRVY